MAFPDRIERSVDLAHLPAKVWAALTTPKACLPGSATGRRSTCAQERRRQMTFRSGLTVDMRIERVEEPTVFGFTGGSPTCPRTIRAGPMSSSPSKR